MNVLTDSKGKQGDIKLIVMIYSIFHKHDKTKQEMLVLVETDMVLYTIREKLHDSLAYFT